ncbi:MAG: hypothetical protein JRI97_01055 [Deltaproteobacteria bacterium]|nr:hypothetical protein [Deltaproteobacteria bacterium]
MRGRTLLFVAVAAVLALAVPAVAGTCPDVYTFEDAIVESAPGGQGAAAGLQLVRLLQHTEMEIGPTYEDLYKFFLESIEHFDFPSFYQSEHLYPLPEGGRGVAIFGVNKGESYYLDATGPDILLDPRPTLGSFVARLSLEKKGSGETYLGRMAVRAFLEGFSHQNFLALNEGFMRVADPDNVKALQAYKNRSLRHIPQESLQVIRRLYADMPRLAPLLKDYIYMLHTDLVRETHGGKKYTRCILRIYPRVDVVRRDYPALGAYLQNLRGLYTLAATVRNDAGHIIARFASDSENDLVTLTLYTREGKFIPFDEEGTPLFNEEFSLTGLSRYAFTMESELLVNVYGLHFSTGSIKVRGAYVNSDKKAVFALSLEDVGPTTVSGKLADVVPKWVVDLTIPSNLAEHINSFNKVMVNADNGRGTRMEVAWNHADPRNITLMATGTTEFADNFYVRFALATFRYLFRPTAETMDDYEMLKARVLTAITLDLKDMQARAGERRASAR